MTERSSPGSVLDWAVSRWHAEVKNRPLRNVHRRSLDDTWRQVIRYLGGDDEGLCGPRHDDLVAAFPQEAVRSAPPEPSHIMCIGWPTIKRLAAGESVWFDDLQCGAIAADDLHGAPIDLMLAPGQQRAVAQAAKERRCQKCGRATKGEEVLVDGQIWCHPCADDVPQAAQDTGGQDLIEGGITAWIESLPTDAEIRNDVRKAALEEAAVLMQRWSDEAAEFKDSQRCVIQGNVCHAAAVAIRNLYKSDSLTRPERGDRS